MPSPLERAALVLSATLLTGGSCKQPSESNYDAELAEEAAQLTLRAGDVEPGVLEVWLTGSFDASDGCPVFAATAKVNGKALDLVQKGGVIQHSEASFEDSKGKCTLPVWRLGYPSEQAQPDQLDIELTDGSGRFHAAVRAPAGTPQLQLSAPDAAPGARVTAALMPVADARAARVVLLDAAASRRVLNVEEPTEGGLSFQVPVEAAPGAALVEVLIPNWIAPEVLACDGPSACQLSVRESLGRYAERSTVSASLEVR